MSSTISKITLAETETIAQIEVLYEKLLQAWDVGQQTEIDAANVARIDTAALQCLVIFHRSQQKRNVPVTIDFPSEVFVNAAKMLGVAETLAVNQQASGLF
ncbi:MAG: STAS domain-containing protein [Methylococcales bacterium]|nr:STAS domain-containing protein [Methylococcales bacterium]